MTPALPVHPRPLQAFWRALTQFDRKRIDLWMGFRNAIGVVVPLAIGVHLGYPASGLVGATGGLNVAAADGTDSYRNRAARMLTSSVIGAFAVLIGALAARNAPAVFIVRTLWAFAAGLVVCLGPAAADIGMISLVVIVIYTAQSMTPAHAAGSGLIALVAGLFQTGLSIALWPIRARQPERKSIGDFYLALARAATVPANPYGAPLASAQSTQAREALSSLATDHSVAAERLFLLVAQAERIRLSLFALSRCLARLRRETPDEPAAAHIDLFLDLASKLLASIGDSLQGAPPPEQIQAWMQQTRSAHQDLGQSADRDPNLAEARLQIDALAGQLRAAFDLAQSTTPAGEQAFVAREERTPWNLKLSGWLATLRANLSLDSSACRHGIRLALCIAIGDLIARIFSLPRSYWLPMTIALVLKPDFGSTFSRGVLRLAGTYLGLLVASVLFHFVSPAVYVHILTFAILVFIQRSVGRANYGVMVTAISALIVFLFSLNGIAPNAVIAARALNTTIGGAVALAVYLVWPTREQTHVPPALAAMLDGYRLYFQALSRAYIDAIHVDPRQLDRLRVAGRRARSNLETSIDRLSAEPSADPAQLRLLNAMLASSHRFAHSAMALEAGQTFVVPGESFKPFAHDLELVLYLLAARLRGSPVARESLPNLREDHNRLAHALGNSDSRNAWLAIETDRMTNSLNTLTEQVFGWLEPAP